MNRKEFLSLIGFCTTGVAMASCLAGCAKSVSSATDAPSNVDFTLDLSQAANAALLNNGGYIYKNDVLVARTLAGACITVQQVCIHENISVSYQPNIHRFYCDGHGQLFPWQG